MSLPIRPPSRPPPTEEASRQRWVTPQIAPMGSARRLIRGASGRFGDPGTPIGKRT